MYNMQKAQGTIEYLVIMAVIIVIGLLVVGMASTFLDSSSGISNTNNKLNNILGSGGISILESALDESGNGAIVFKNTSGETLIIQKIATENKELTYENQTIPAGNNAKFTLEDLNLDCPCINNNPTICTFTITYQTTNGITDTETLTTTTDCLGNDYTPDENPLSPVLCPTYAGLQEKDGNLIICDCNDLQNINQNPSTNYLLGQDINCYSNTHQGGDLWNDSNGFAPISFSGVFNGQNFSINGIYINRPNNGTIGLFSVNSGSILNLKLIATDVTGDSATGGLVGRNRNLINNCSVSGNVRGNYYATGGLVGMNEYNPQPPSQYLGIINLSISSATINGPSYVGGLVGNNAGQINNSYAFGIVNGSSDVGGLVGVSTGLSINKSYSSAVVNCSFSNCGGLVGRESAYSTHISNYWDISVSGQPTSAIGTGKSTTNMMQESTFIDWNFDSIWAINETTSYPYLQWEQ
jgi:hypothetical protein